MVYTCLQFLLLYLWNNDTLKKIGNLIGKDIGKLGMKHQLDLARVVERRDCYPPNLLSNHACDMFALYEPSVVEALRAPWGISHSCLQDGRWGDKLHVKKEVRSETRNLS
jgi:hypothetical protein